MASELPTAESSGVASARQVLKGHGWRNRLLGVADAAIGLLGVLGLAFVLYDRGFPQDASSLLIMRWLERIVSIVALGFIAARLVGARERAQSLRRYAIPLILWVAALAAGFVVGWGGDDTGLAHAVQDLALFGVGVIESGRRVTWMTRLQVHPSLIVLGVFAVLIAFGTLVLVLPEATTGTGVTGFVDALFTATSAVCVTGLVVVPTGPHFSWLGESAILLMIQLGGIGIISTATVVALLIGGPTPLRTRYMMQEIQDTDSMGEVKGVLVQILLVTLGIEAVGAVLLYLTVDLSFTSTMARVYYAVFHAISAFCNAGFSTRPTSLTEPALATDWGVNAVFMALIILGGVGFVVLRQSFTPQRWRRGPFGASRYRIQARIVWWTTAVLIVVGAAGLFVLEQGDALADAVYLDGAAQRWMAALFQSVTARTAGFNTVDIGALSGAGALLVMALMFIGASPGSTGGGLRTTTFTLLVLYAVSVVRGSSRVDLMHRTVAPHQVRHAVVLLLTTLTVVFAATLLLAAFEPFPFVDVLFEAVSAVGTVGLSRGITAELSTASKLVVIVTMFAGRVGLLAFALYMAGPGRPRPYRYPEESIMLT